MARRSLKGRHRGTEGLMRAEGWIMSACVNRGSQKRLMLTTAVLSAGGDQPLERWATVTREVTSLLVDRG